MSSLRCVQGIHFKSESSLQLQLAIIQYLPHLSTNRFHQPVIQGVPHILVIKLQEYLTF